MQLNKKTSIVFFRKPFIFAQNLPMKAQPVKINIFAVINIGCGSPNLNSKLFIELINYMIDHDVMTNMSRKQYFFIVA